MRVATAYPEQRDGNQAQPRRAVQASPAGVDPRRWLALAVVLAGTFMSIFDFFIVNVAVPSIQRDLHASFGAVQLVIAGYALAYAVLLITGGRLGDLYGRRRLFMVGLGCFTFASALCGLAPNAQLLVVSRVLQGLGAAVMIPQVLSVIQVNFSPAERATAFGIYGAVLGTGSVAGQITGGLLIQANLLGLDWRPIFLVNVPIGIGALLAAALLVPESRAPAARRLDLGGMLLVTAGLALLIFPLIEGRDAGWPAWSFAMLALSLPLLLGFVRYERWLSVQGGAPLIELSLFRNATFDKGLLIVVSFFSSNVAFFLLMALYLQLGLGFSPLASGLTFTPFAAGFFGASLLAVRLTPRLGRSVLSLGAALLLSGFVSLILAVQQGGASLYGYQLLPELALAGIGSGLVLSPLFSTVLRDTRAEEAGSASGVLSTVQQVAGALGVALLGIVFFGLLGHHFNAAGYTRAFTVALLGNVALTMATFVLIFYLPAGEGETLRQHGAETCINDNVLAK